MSADPDSMQFGGDGRAGDLSRRVDRGAYGLQSGEALPEADPGVTYPRFMSFRNPDLTTPAAVIALCPFGHQGLMHDEEIAPGGSAPGSGGGLVHNRARTLHPGVGRFMQRDPLGYVDGMSVHAAYHILRRGTDPLGLNRDTTAERNRRYRIEVIRKRLAQAIAIRIASDKALNSEASCCSPDERQKVIRTRNAASQMVPRYKARLNDLLGNTDKADSLQLWLDDHPNARYGTPQKGMCVQSPGYRPPGIRKTTFTFERPLCSKGLDMIYAVSLNKSSNPNISMPNSAQTGNPLPSYYPSQNYQDNFTKADAAVAGLHGAVAVGVEVMEGISTVEITVWERGQESGYYGTGFPVIGDPVPLDHGRADTCLRRWVDIK